MKETIRILTIAGILLLFGTLSAFACQMRFKLIDENGTSQVVTPGRAVTLTEGEIYTLVVEFTEDHGNCPVDADETEFLLEEEKWKSSKDYLPLQLINSISWRDVGKLSHIAELKFKASDTGSWELEIIRDCTKKDGYDEYFTFVVK